MSLEWKTESGHEDGKRVLAYRFVRSVLRYEKLLLRMEHSIAQAQVATASLTGNYWPALVFKKKTIVSD